MALGCLDHPVAQSAICARCAALEQAARARRRRWLVGIVLAAPVLGIGGYLIARSSGPKPIISATSADPIDQIQRERLAQTPCDLETHAARVHHLMKLERWQDALEAAHRAIGCGARGQVQWHVVYINQQLHRWFPAAIGATEQIAGDPHDSDYWWWRGEAWAEGELPQLALADYRQSIASSASPEAARFAVGRFYAPAHAAHEPCEAERAWHYFVEHFEGEPNDEMRDQSATLIRNGSCVAEHGTGRATLSGKVRATVAGATGTFAIDYFAGTTLVSRLFAGKAGLVASDKPLATGLVEFRPVLGEPITLSKVAVGGAATTNVDALIVDELPAGVDGTLGLSFLWHFDWTWADDGVRVTPLHVTPL